MPNSDSGRIDNAWAVHQAETTVDFARRSRAAAWLLGGLNFQIEHHLFPRVCHVHYPALSKVAEATCRDFGMRYTEHESVWAGLKSHFRWLRQMGMPIGGTVQLRVKPVQHDIGTRLLRALVHALSVLAPKSEKASTLKDSR